MIKAVELLIIEFLCNLTLPLRLAHAIKDFVLVLAHFLALSSSLGSLFRFTFLLPWCSHIGYQSLYPHFFLQVENESNFKNKCGICLPSRIPKTPNLSFDGCSLWSLQTLAYEEVRTSPNRPYYSTAFIFHVLLGGRNWRPFNQNLLSRLSNSSFVMFFLNLGVYHMIIWGIFDRETYCLLC